jgi:undecaprenyl-diphosphatase
MARVAKRRVGLLVGLLVLFAALLVLVVTEWGPLHRLDLSVATNLHDVVLDHPGQVDFWQWTSRVLHPDVERIAAAAAAIVLWFRRRRQVALFIVAVMIVEAVLNAGVKYLVDRDRPVFADPVAHAAGQSFPSGHAFGAFVAFGLLVLLVPRRWKLVAGGIAALAVLLVSYSRLALGVHYLSDVVGGWLLGAAWLVLATFAIARSDESPEDGAGR